MSFDQLQLSEPLLLAIAELDYKTPTAVQIKAIPLVLSGRDILACAQTGTGKTAGYSLPLLQRLDTGNRAKPNQARSLILVPTRELAIQVGDNIREYSKHTTLRSLVVYGGSKINPQMMKLRNGVDVLIATPGRLLDLHQKNAVRFQQLETLILDEADRMLDLGFEEELQLILRALPKKRQNLMFSATFSTRIRTLAKAIVHKPIEVQIAAPNSTVPEIVHWLVPVDKKRKPQLLVHLIRHRNWSRALVFVKTKKGADRLVTALGKADIKSAAIHGDKSQALRTKALERFKQKTINVLVATDVAARGIDIDQLQYVVNLDLPIVATDYIHRVGRTARAGASGEAISLVCADEHKQLIEIEQLLGKIICREYEPGFEPGHEVPASPSPLRPVKAKKPKKPKKPKTFTANKKKIQTSSTAPKNKKRIAKGRNNSGH